MNKDYYNWFLPHIIETHNPMLQIHGRPFQEWHRDDTKNSLSTEKLLRLLQRPFRRRRK